MAKGRYLDKEKARELYDKGFHDQEIADVCGFSRDTVAAWRRSAGLPGHKGHIQPKKKKASISELSRVAAEAREHGMTYGQYVAKVLEVKND